MQKTNIEYLDYTWNPLAMRCSPVSEGCLNCWHLKFANRHAGNKRFSDDCLIAYMGGPSHLKEDELEAPYKKKRSRIGVQFMGDLYHEKNSFETIWRIYDVMSGSAQLKGHNFFVLTKRLERALEFFHWVKVGLEENRRKGRMIITWPSPKVWLGASCENQEMFDKRWAILKQIPAAVYMISYEPALGQLILPSDFLALGKRAWVVVGGESGSKARPMHPDWPRKVRNDCVAAGVSYFFKQWGEWGPGTREEIFGGKTERLKVHSFVKRLNPGPISSEIHTHVFKFGKKAAGRKLDGKIYNEFPGRV